MDTRVFPGYSLSSPSPAAHHHSRWQAAHLDRVPQGRHRAHHGRSAGSGSQGEHG